MTSYSKKEKLHIFLSSFLHLEYGAKVKLLALIGEDGFAKSFRESKQEVIKITGEELYFEMEKNLSSSYVEDIIGELDKNGITALTVCSDNYPENLRNLTKKPFVLYCKGNISLLKEKSVAIVGSRCNIPLSVSIAKNYSESLSKSGITVITGIADGIDEEVIDSALESGRIISVTAGGLDKIHPAKNFALAEKVVKNGLLISEYPLKVSAQKFNYPLRNRIIAGLSDAVIIISGKIDSGTKYTAEYAKEYDKKVFAPPYNIGVSSGEICNELIKNGASLTTTPEDILSYFGIAKQEEVKEDNKILEYIGREPVTAEKISEYFGIGIGELLPQLAMLELEGLIYRSSGNTYGRTGNKRRN